MQACGKPVSSGTGKVLKPRGSQHLLFIIHDLDLPQPDKYSTVQLVAWVHQIVAHGGFYDAALDFVSVQRIQIVATVSPPGTPGRSALTTRLTSNVRIVMMPVLSQASASVIVQARIGALPHPMQPTASSKLRIADALCNLIAGYAASFRGGALEHCLVAPTDAVHIIDALMHYKPSSDDGAGCSFADALHHEVRLQLRQRLSSASDRARFDSMLQQVLTPAVGPVSSPADSMLTTLGAAAAQRLTGSDAASSLSAWSNADFAALVRPCALQVHLLQQ